MCGPALGCYLLMVVVGEGLLSISRIDGKERQKVWRQYQGESGALCQKTDPKTICTRIPSDSKSAGGRVPADRKTYESTSAHVNSTGLPPNSGQCCSAPARLAVPLLRLDRHCDQENHVFFFFYILIYLFFFFLEWTLIFKAFLPHGYNRHTHTHPPTVFDLCVSNAERGRITA